jgi:hypothetical protein
MPDEHESAFAAWLDLPETRREMEVIKSRLSRYGEIPSLFEVLQIALSMEMLVSLNVYGDRDEADLVIELPPKPPDDDDEPEPWKDPDNTGWMP